MAVKKIKVSKAVFLPSYVKWASQTKDTEELNKLMDELKEIGEWIDWAERELSKE
tara:strand:+ start:196 stop:360 length:165 start_codon:yes stop_codon:yes gene_type:complete